MSDYDVDHIKGIIESYGVSPRDLTQEEKNRLREILDEYRSEQGIVEYGSLDSPHTTMENITKIMAAPDMNHQDIYNNVREVLRRLSITKIAALLSVLLISVQIPNTFSQNSSLETVSVMILLLFTHLMYPYVVTRKHLNTLMEGGSNKFAAGWNDPDGDLMRSMPPEVQELCAHIQM